MYNWQQIMDRAAQMPALEELHAQKNGIETLASSQPLESVLPHISNVDLNGNSICSWDEIWKLSSLSRLSKLALISNRLGAIWHEAGDGAQPFGALKSLSIGDNLIGADSGPHRGGGWDAVSALDNLPALTDLRCTGNPLFELPLCDVITARHWIIGRVAGVKTLNASHVTVPDRIQAEKQYLRKCHADLRDGLDNEEAVIGTPEVSDQFVASNPRFPALNAFYDDVQHEGSAASKKSQLAANVIKIDIRSEDEDWKERPAVRKKVTSTMSVAKLKAICYRLYKPKGGPRKIVLVYTSKNAEVQGANITLDEWDSDLQYYGVEDGGTIVVQKLT
jgi:hypothetical protein